MSEWTENEDGRGICFESDDGRSIEVYLSNGGLWATDILHKYGCTRYYLGESKAEAMHRAVHHMNS